jgi:hypothetical protein
MKSRLFSPGAAPAGRLSTLWRLPVALAVASLLLAGCAGLKQPPPKEESPPPYRLTERGTAVYGEEFEFEPPPQEWRLVRVAGEEEGEAEFSFAFLRLEQGPHPSQSIFAYDEEPFGSSRDLETRAKEHFQRFLWGANVRFEILGQERVPVVGGTGLAVLAEGRSAGKEEKVRSKVVFAKRGDRVVSFYLSQWRSLSAEYDPEAFAVFDRFVESFRYLKGSFYEKL